MKRKLLILSVLAICLAILAAGTFAYFTSEDTAHNVITTGGVKIAVQEWADDRLHQMCGRITPGKRLAVILVMFFFFGGLSIYITVSSIYNIGKRDGRRLQIEHIKQLPLQGNDTINSINPLNRPEYGRSTEE